MRFSVPSTLWNDWPSLAAAVGLPIIWAMHFVFPFISDNEPISVAVPLAVSAALALTLLWRLQRIARLFRNGRLVVGEITRLSLVKDRGRLEFSFQLDGKRIEAWMPIHKSKAVLALQPGLRVDVLVDASQPKLAIVKCLYE